MSQIERNDKMVHLWDKTELNKEDVLTMSDAQIEYFHWLYLEDSVYDLM